MSNGKMKGFFKGLKYISKKFESEKEPEIQIGAPTDVKHVAHIGWDGPSVNPPSWMSDYKGEASEAAGDKDSDDGSQTSTTKEAPTSTRRVRSEREKTRGSRRASRHSLRESESCSALNNSVGQASKRVRRKKHKDPALSSSASSGPRRSKADSSLAGGSGSNNDSAHGSSTS